MSNRFLRWLGWPGIASAGVALVLMAALLVRLELDIARADAKIRLLQAEIEKLDPQIADVAKLRDVIAGVLARKQVVEALVADRYAVQLLEELAARRPPGVYLVAVQNAGRQFSVTGYAASPARADAFLRRLAESTVFTDARLVETRQEATAKPYPIRFAISMSRRSKEPAR